MHVCKLTLSIGGFICTCTILHRNYFTKKVLYVFFGVKLTLWWLSHYIVLGTTLNISLILLFNWHLIRLALIFILHQWKLNHVSVKHFGITSHLILDQAWTLSAWFQSSQCSTTLLISPTFSEHVRIGRDKEQFDLLEKFK